LVELEARLVDLHDLEAALEAARNEEQRLRLALEMQGTKLHRYRELFDFAPVSLLTLNPAGLIESVNLNTAKLLGLPRANLEGQPLLRFIEPHSHRNLLEHLRRCRRSEYSVCTELELSSYGGENRIPVEIHSHRLPGDTGPFLSTLIDLSERARVEEERRRVMEAQAATRAKDRFLATLSHELRTPLSPIANLIEVMKLRRDLPEDLRPLLATMERNLWLEVRLVEDLLDTTRIASNKLQLKREELDLHRLLQEVLEMLADEFQKAEIRLVPLFEAKRSRIDADPARLRQVFWNLLKNTLKFTPAGGQVRVQSRNPVPGQIEFRVVDTGLGMDPVQIERLFEPFEQVRDAHRGGLGLGLTIAKGIVEAHGGGISATSRGRDRGSSFNVVLPIQQ
jgi:PAS domain S-box-containing protein